MLIKTGIYSIQNTVNGRLYIGSAAKSFSDRWSGHRSALREGTHCNLALQRAWKKYGESSFLFSILVRCCPEECLKEEQRFIDDLWSTGRLYNHSPTAGSLLGIKHRPEVAAKLAARCRRLAKANLGRKVSEETRKRMSESHKGKKISLESIRKRIETLRKLEYAPSDEARRNMAAAQRGKKMSDDAKKKQSESMKKRWANEGFREKMKKAHSNVRMSDQGKKNISSSLVGRKLSAEHRANLSKVRKGKPWSETRRKNYEARKQDA